MAIRDWPADQQPREKLLQRGPEALSDAELLAIFLRVGVKGQSAVDLSRALLQRFDGIRGLLTADQQQFCAERGLGPAKYVQLQAVLELARRHLMEPLVRGAAVGSSQAATDYMRLKLGDRSQEVFACLFLDAKHRVIQFEEMFFGSIDRTSVYPREVVKRALAHNAAAVIFAHNHPSGDSSPSSQDRAITVRLEEALSLVDVRVLDHVIVGDQQALSLREEGGWSSATCQSGNGGPYFR